MPPYGYSIKKCRYCDMEFRPASGVQRVCFSKSCRHQRMLDKSRRKHKKKKEEEYKANLARYYKNKELYQDSSKTKLCDCGCGSNVLTTTARGKPYRFLPGHYLKIYKNKGIPYPERYREIAKNSRNKPYTIEMSFAWFMRRHESTRKMFERLQTDEVQMKRLAGLIKRPNKVESMVIDTIKQFKIPLTYTGNGKMIIDKLNPDFVNIDKKKIVEVFGEYWHSGISNMFCVDKDIRRQRLKNHGYDLLILWESEIKSMSSNEIAKRLIEFVGGDVQ